MKEIAAELFGRFVAGLAADPEGPLYAHEVQAAYSQAPAPTPFHTVVINGRHEGQDGPLALVLVTTPAATPDDPKVLEFAVRRARAYKTPYFVTWTLRAAILWKTPKPGVPAARDALESLKDYPDIYDISAGDAQTLIEPVKLKVVARGKDILLDLRRLLRDEALELVKIDATYFVGRLLEAVQQLLPMVSNSIHHRLQSDIAFRDELTAWALQQTIAGSPTDPAFAESVARQIVYRLLGKVLFYQSLRRTARQLPKLDFDAVDTSQVLPGLRAAFAQALKIDYHAIFEEDLPDRIQWPSDASRELAGLIHDFNTRDFARLPQDVVGTVFERLIPPEERHSLGQYFTSEDLCDLVNAFCITSSSDKVLDPTCGTGTFLIRAYDRLRWLGQTDHATLLSQIWGVDIARFPAELATINLFRQRVAEHGNFPRIICADFLKVNPGDRFEFPPPKMDLEHPETIEEPIPLFDAIVGNFPYVSADQIEKHEAGYLEFLRKRLVEDWFDEYPQLFYYPKKSQQDSFETLVANDSHRDGCERGSVQHKLSGFADLYVHMFYHVARFLKAGSRMGIVTSNAWLDVGYGQELHSFFLNHFKIIAILESRCEPWFVEASVNTVVTILERCGSESERDAHLVKFVKVKRPLPQLIPGDPVIEAAARWQRLRSLVGQVEQAGRKYAKTRPLGIITEEDELHRTRIVRQGELAAGVSGALSPSKWGYLLRAPEVVLDARQEAGSGLALLGELAAVKFGSKTGINDFYHVTSDTIARFGIEPQYLAPLIRAADDTSKQLCVEPSTLEKQVFICRKAKDELRQCGHFGALRYIEWGEQQTFGSGKLAGMTWPHGIEVKDRKPGWYALPEYRSYAARVFWQKAYHDTYLQRYSETDLIPDQRLYFLDPSEGVDPQLLSAVLNSFLAALALECIAPVAAGEGVCEVRLEDARDSHLVPDLRNFTAPQSAAILKAFQPLKQRSIHRIPEEVRQRDRQAFDSAVLKSIGLEPKNYLKRLYEGLCELVRERIELGQMRGKARKTKARGTKAEKQVAQQVLDEILPDGPLRFPDEFFSAAAAAGPKQAVELPDAALLLDVSPLFTGVHTADTAFSRNVKNPAEGKFLLYAQRAGQRTAQLPQKTVEVTRTVANYEKYLRELRSQLYEAYYRRTLDTRTAAKLTQAAFDRFRLPNPESLS